MENILDYSLEELQEWLVDNKNQKFRANQIFNWIYNEIWDFQNMSNLPNELVMLLKENFYIEIPKIIEVYESKIDDTKKFLLSYRDNNIIECVIMKYKHGNTICVSTQVGCRMGCKFCASTIGGLVRNLTSGEIISQLLVCKKYLNESISNIVLMGSGEPLDNYDNVIKFINIVNSNYSFNIGSRHITLSTSGIVPNIYRLADEKMQITLAISLHAADDGNRKKIMPIANKYNIEEILNACRYYIDKTNRRISFEYALVKDVNDNKEESIKLSKLLKNFLCHVNLIPVNSIKESTFNKPDIKSIKEFAATLKKNGIETTIRREMGSDINAACGQLRKNYISKNMD